MKKTVVSSVSIVLALVFMLFAVSCAKKVDATGAWENATYLKDTTLGKGDKEIKVEIEAGGQSITLTVKTDKATLGEALYELELTNDATFFDTLNGMKADFNDGGMFWKFMIDGEAAAHGVGDEKISGGESYKFLMTNEW